jgi:hypothetical protein
MFVAMTMCANLNGHAPGISSCLSQWDSVPSGRSENHGAPASSAYDAHPRITFVSGPPSACFGTWLGEKPAEREAIGRWFRATEDMPVLRPPHFTWKTQLPGMWKVIQNGIAADTNRTNKMPFSGDCHSFDPSTFEELDDVGSVYGLFKSDLPFRPDHYTCLFVGETNQLRTRLLQDYSHPPIPGVTHFFAEATASGRQREVRAHELIAEFNPPGNKTDGIAAQRSV